MLMYVNKTKIIYGRGNTITHKSALVSSCKEMYYRENTYSFSLFSY